MKTKSKKFKLDFTPIGQVLKQAREAKDITREQISEIVDYVPRHIQSIENEGKSPNIDLLFQLAELLDVSLDQHIFKDKPSVKSSIRRRVDKLLDDLPDKDLIVVEATVKGILKAKALPEG